MIAIGTIATKIHPPERSHVEISNPDDVERYLEEMYGARLRLTGDFQAQSDGGTLLKHERVDVGPFPIDSMRIPGTLHALPDPLERVLVVWPTDGSVAGRCGGIDGRAGAGEITLTSQPDLPSQIRAEDIAVTSVLLDHSLVAGVATGMPSVQAPLPVRFAEFEPVDRLSCKLWQDTVRYVQASVLSSDVFATPLVLGHASRLLAAVTLSTFRNTVTADPRPADRTDTHPVLLRRAIEYIDSHAINDIGLADIAETVHVTPRAVQYMFRRHLDTTPVAYLRRVRLHYAHQDLLAADRAKSTVSAIAARWGFAHMGRFAVLHREMYGESPHTALRS